MRTVKFSEKTFSPHRHSITPNWRSWKARTHFFKLFHSLKGRKLARKSIQSAIANCPRCNLCGSREKRIFSFLNWLLAFNGNYWWTRRVYSIGGRGNCRQSESSHGKEGVIYFNQFLPTSNSSRRRIASRIKVILTHARVRWDRWLFPHLHNYCSINKHPREIKWKSLLRFYFLTPEERRFVC